MSGRLAGTMFAAAAWLALGACGNDGSSAAGYGGSYAGGYSGGDSCQAFTSCEACTPQNGCGWCYDSDGTGQCVSGPDECLTQAFEWTWNPSGCRVAAGATTAPAGDAGELIEDAGEPEETSTVVAIDASQPVEASTAPAVDAGERAETSTGDAASDAPAGD